MFANQRAAQVSSSMSRYHVILLAAVAAALIVGFVFLPTNAPPDRLLWQKSVRATLHADPAASLGTVFTRRAGDMVCAAGFINTNNARRASNQNDLEFWCRDQRTPAADFEFSSLARPLAGHLKSSIANVNGKLFEYISGRIYDDDEGDWKPYAGGIDGYAHPMKGQPIRLQRSGDRRWSFIWHWRECTGIAVVSDRGYHGSLTGKISSVFVYQDRIYANIDFKIVSYPIPIAAAGHCRSIGDPTVYVQDDNWVYSMMPSNGAMIVGGSARGRPCASLYRIVPGGSVTTLNYPECGSRRVTEFYSYLNYNDDLLVGTYPDGNLVRVSGEIARLTDAPIPVDENDRDRRRYFESQSMTIAAGDLLVGMYPWGQLFRRPYGADAWRSQRLFSGPRITDELHPYYDAMAEKLATIKPAHSAKKKRRRALGLFSSAWGQRVTTLAVFNGRLCAGTGNMSGSPWNAEYHPMVPEKIAKQYGRIYCARIANHTLGAIDWRGSTEFTFKVTDRRLVIEQDGSEIASNQHSLTAEQLAELERAGKFESGRGVYGRFQGELQPAQ